MTPADLARANAIALEVKKDSLRQNQDGTWKIVLTVQAIDMDRRLTHAMPGTRYQAVLVEIGDDELPVQRAEVTSPAVDAKPGKRSAGVKQDWADMLPSAQAAMLGDKADFRNFLALEHKDDWHESMSSPAECIRLICGVGSRADLNTNHRARVAWHTLQSEFEVWKMKDRVGA
jgi:hypothetical protein